MKNVAIDARYLLRPQRGMPVYVHMLCRYLPTIMHDVRFFILINKGFEHNDKPENYCNRLEEINQPANVTIINEDSEDEIKWELYLLPKLLKRLSIDLLHMPGNRVCLTTSVKQLVTFHDTIEWSQLKLLKGISLAKSLKRNLYELKLKIYKFLIYFYGLRLAEHILTISQYSENSLHNCFPNVKNRTSFVHHGLPPNFAINTPLLSRKQKFGVLMLGGDSYQKNPENAIRAWSMLSDELRKQHPLKIVGFTGDAESPLMRQISMLNIAKEVTLKKWITEDELFDSFNSCYVFLFASREEGFGFPLLQAMSRGTPAICSNAEVLKEIGQDAILTAEAESPLELSKRMELVLTSVSTWERLRQNALKRVELFQWQDTCDFIAKIYRKLL